MNRFRQRARLTCAGEFLEQAALLTFDIGILCTRESETPASTNAAGAIFGLNAQTAR
jgi:hypothetical protein